MSVNHLLALLPSAPRLARLRLEAGAAASAKFQPCAPHARASLRWLWSVVRLQGLHHQFGLRCAHAWPARGLDSNPLASARHAAWAWYTVPGPERSPTPARALTCPTPPHSGHEMEARRHQLLLDDRLRFKHGADAAGEAWSEIKVIRDERVAAAAQAGPANGAEPL